MDGGRRFRERMADIVDDKGNPGDCCRTGRRDAFLDTARQPDVIIRRLYQLVNCALTTGTAIGIGHPFPETAAAIHQFRAEIEGTGVEISSLSSVLKPKRPAGPNQFRPIATRI